MFRLVAEDPTIALNEMQAARITSWLLELIPARGCHVRREPVVEITITGHYPEDFHLPLLRRVEEIAGCRFSVSVVDG
ncbi:hypothetical protein AB0368_21910 [Actinoplanes sp. NPDC051475]|uniref:hypothetical protein n=1 Tax=Actinoplanes sp. NPDC051475 TaxID=3157225 RepID=UPI00344E4072